MRKGLVGIVAGTLLAGCVYTLEPYPGYQKETTSSEGTFSEESNIVWMNRAYRPKPESKNRKKFVQEWEVERVNIEDWEGINYDTYDPEEVAFVDSFADKPYEELWKIKLTPREVGMYCNNILKHGGEDYDKKTYHRDYWQSGRVTHLYKGGDCDDVAVAAAALLAPRGFPPNVVVMEGDGEYAHAVFLYRDQNGLYGAIGINRVDVQPPKYAHVIDLVKDIGNKLDENYYKYKIVNLGWNGEGFIDNNSNNDPRE